MVNFELSLLDMIQKLHSSVLNRIMILLTKAGDLGIIWILLVLLLLLNKNKRQAGYVAVLALIFNALLCNVIIKPAVARIRPYEINTYVELLINKMSDYSFPSGHASAGFAVATALFYMKEKKLTICAYILAILISFSRLYLYVHFPTDVLGGMILGAACGELANIVYHRFVKVRTVSGNKK